MITSENQHCITQERVRQFADALAELDAHPDPDPAAHQVSRNSVTSILATLRRELAMWEAGIREPVPGNRDLIQSPWTSEQINAMDDEEYERTSAAAGVLLKRAEIAQIDRAIGEALDRIADWRRHRAWLEREIAELEQRARAPQASGAS